MFEGDKRLKTEKKVVRRLGTIFNGHKIIKNYDLMQTLEFDSTRKRMSVIVRRPDEDSYILYCKGADTPMIKKSRPDNMKNLIKCLSVFSNQGLRTLVLAYRVLSATEYKEYEKLLSDAKNDIINREEKLNEAYDKIESNLKLIGVTAVEDKLQDDVENTLRALREAGIKIWVLTGDKLETAVNISESCKHFSTEMKKFRLENVRSEEQLHQRLVAIDKQ